MASTLEAMYTYLWQEAGQPDLPEATLYERWRHLVNVRPAEPISEEYLALEDQYLQANLKASDVVTLEDLEPIQGEQLYLWQGDITQLAVDGIVNAANSDMLGCFLPNHSCIDNIIHTKAGVRLRLACQDLMEAQGRKEPVGKAKITPGFNLPSEYVLHTVGPMVPRGQQLSPMKEAMLVKSYQACLKLAEAHHLDSLAFCCISTGVFGFPGERASELAVATVKAYLQETGSPLKVVFNVFKDEDLYYYQKQLGGRA